MPLPTQQDVPRAIGYGTDALADGVDGAGLLGTAPGGMAEEPMAIRREPKTLKHGFAAFKRSDRAEAA